MIFKIIGTIILTIAAGVFYRMGGKGKPYPFWARELGVSVCLVLELLLLGYFHWSIMICLGACYGLQSSYFKKKGHDAKWWNWVLVGIAFSLTVLPLVWFTKNWIGFGIRSAFLIVMMPIWCIFISDKISYLFRKTLGDDVIEEFGRGVLMVGTLPLLIINL